MRAEHGLSVARRFGWVHTGSLVSLGLSPDEAPIWAPWQTTMSSADAPVCGCGKVNQWSEDRAPQAIVTKNSGRYAGAAAHMGPVVLALC